MNREGCRWNKAVLKSYAVRPILLLGVLFAFAFAFIFNFFWEALHSVYLYKSHNFNAERYVRMLVYVASIDGSLILMTYLGSAAVFRDLNWVRSANGVRFILFAAVNIVTAAAIEVRAVYFVHRWQYRAGMPTIMGIGISPLIQLGLTGLITVWLVRSIFFRKGYFQE